MNEIEQNEESLRILREKGYIKGSVSSYRSPALAEHAAKISSIEPRRIVLGDHPWFWVVSPADAERLREAGYESISETA